MEMRTGNFHEAYILVAIHVVCIINYSVGVYITSRINSASKKMPAICFQKQEIEYSAHCWVYIYEISYSNHNLVEDECLPWRYP